MSARPLRRRLRRILLGAAVLSLVCGTAFAFWGTSGNGASSSAAVTPVDVTLAPGTPIAKLYPGGVSDVVLTVSNPNVTSAHISTLALDTAQGTSGFAVDAGHLGCTLSSLSYTSQTNGSAGWTVPGKVGGVNGSLAITLANALTMGVGAANACQGAIFTVYLVAS